MTTLHVFNPEHDIALARNNKYFTAPRAGRKLREDCCFLPVLWAKEGDFILVSNRNQAFENIKECGIEAQGINLTTLNELHSLPEGIRVDPWGWDSSLCFELEKNGLKSGSIPDEGELKDIRYFSNRRFASEVLTKLRNELACNGIDSVGEAFSIDNVSTVENNINDNSKVVLKEPWSSSGRGVRFVDCNLNTETRNWAKKIIQQQGCIMLEPYYHKICDFGMEFIADEKGVQFRGLSVFNTSNGFYDGNLILPEEKKVEILSKFISKEEIEAVYKSIERLLTDLLGNKFSGLLGVDMMIVEKADRKYLHPMVEINMRRTMGHVAIDAYNKFHKEAIMRIRNDGKNYKLSLESLPS